ncbi:MAG TPA: Arc family DNA-binding protein [Pseudolabrys sp.]|nr:Arc family DNA-binding protein [Pseudolabrys sp.]
MAVSELLRRRLADKSQVAQLKVRLPEVLRWSLEREASSRGHSMNTEIVRRLRESFLAQDKTTTLIAKTLLSGLDDAVIEKMVEIVMRERAEEEMAEMAREDAVLDRDDGEGSK